MNPDSAKNMGEGGIIDGIGNALFGELTFKEGVPDKNNFHQYKMIRQKEAPKNVDIHFVKNEVEPTGLGNRSSLLSLLQRQMHYIKQLGKDIMISRLQNKLQPILPGCRMQKMKSPHELLLHDKMTLSFIPQGVRGVGERDE